MKRLAVPLAVFLSAGASIASAAPDDLDQPIRTFRSSLPKLDDAAAKAADDAPVRDGARSAFMRDRNVSVMERPHPVYQALGMPAGAFLIYPTFTETASYDSNVFARSTGVIADGSFRTAADVKADSNWSRNQFEGFAGVATNQYVSLSKLNTTDYRVGVSGRYDVVGNSNLYADLEGGRHTLPFTNFSLPRNAVDAEQYDLVQGDVGAVQELNRVRFSERFDAADYKYGNLRNDLGDLLIEDTQNHSTYATRGEVEYAVSPATAVFGALTWNARRYQNPGPQGTNSTGYQLTAGASFDISRLMRGRAELGYLQQSYDASPSDNIAAMRAAGPAFRGKIEWFPTQLVTISARANREIEDWTVVGASGTLGSGGGLQVDYELLRNLILSSNAEFDQYKYIGTNRRDRAWTFSHLVSYSMNRHLGFSLGFRHIEQSSNAGGLNYRDNAGFVSVVGKY